MNMVFSDKDKILIKSLYLKGCTTKRVTDEFPEKSWTKRGECMDFVSNFIRFPAVQKIEIG